VFKLGSSPYSAQSGSAPTLVFDISASYGHFKKPYTTTSPLTYSIPTRTAVSGIIAAVLGFGKEDYQEHFTKPQAKIAIGIRNPVKKLESVKI